MFDSLIKRPKVTLTFLVLLVIVGGLTALQLSKREIPEISVNVGTVTTIYPGAVPEMVERTITNPLEGELESIKGIEKITSVSGAGISNIVLEVADNEDRDKVFQEVRQAVSDTSKSFPENVLNSTVNSDIQTGALSSYHLLSDDRELLQSQRDMMMTWKQELEKIAGVRKVAFKGISEDEYLLTLQQEKMKEYGIILPDIINAINNEVEITPLGTQEINSEKKQLSLEHIENIEQVEKIFVTQVNDEAVFIGDLAELTLVPKEKPSLVNYNDSPAISMTILQEKGVDIPSLHDQVDKKVKQLSKDLPQDITLDMYYTQDTIVGKIFKDLGTSFFISILVVVLVTLLGLNFNSSLLVAIAIPSSIALGLIPLPYMGVDLNQISIIGMIIALGILVDDAIVINDNIRRRYRLGDSPLQGALQGAKEVRVSIITSTLAIVFTFLPLLFIGGSSGAFIRALPSVLITTIIGSTIIALTVVPIFLVWRQKVFEKNKKATQKDGLLGKPLEALASWYSQKVLKKIVKFPMRIGLSVLLFCTLVYGLVPFIPVVFFPSADREEVTITVTLPPEQTLLNTEKYLEEMSSYLQKNDPAIYEVTMFAGTSEPGLFGSVVSNPGENIGQLVLRVDRESQTASETIDKWQDQLREIYSEAIISMSTIEAGPPVGAPIAVTVKGEKLDELMNAVNDIKGEISNLDGSGAVLDDVGRLRPTITYSPIREELQKHSITTNEISQQIRLITDGIPMGSYDNGITSRDFTIKLDGVAEGASINLEEIQLPSKAAIQEGPPILVPLSDLVNVNEGEEIQSIPHINGERTITIRTYPKDEQKAAVESEIKEIAENYTSDSISVSVGGESSARSDFFVEVGKLFIIVIFLIYLLMVVQFNSLRIPLLIMSSVYLAISGALIGLFITQTGLGFMAMMGIVSLAGIVVRNATVFIEFMEQRIQEGASLVEAVVESGQARLRPVILTAVTSMGALLPIAFSGDVLFTPLAISIISGIFFSTIFTLLFVPAFYIIIKRKKANNQETAVN
ncbi:efflux RND transporter permease subunit [Metabacillus litoralis]|uniref:Efflux RND transporter permease subunit n=1 Tax=Metabacillus litoralis TaxID=152268 RepID=A0A5C6W661_9BACI|nr:efflux RND transporter permease subunit [Metabacillus litoralis]TXC91311.1 efflux RND transporter permease subunit [Metabacillus litoralis]